MIDFATVSPDLDPAVAHRAFAAYQCASSAGPHPSQLLVVDMSRPSTEQRLWAFDMSDPVNPRLVIQDRVAHGAGSDPRKVGAPVRFGNVPESGMTSLGLYRVAERYSGEGGRPAYALDGLDEGFNSKARPRRVVIHPADYVRPDGRVGRSLGCPAVSRTTFDLLSKNGLNGALLWIDGPVPELGNAPSLQCAGGVPAPLLPSCRPQQSVWTAQFSIPTWVGKPTVQGIAQVTSTRSMSWGS